MLDMDIGSDQGMNSQVIFKLGNIEAQIKSLDGTLTSAIRRLEDTIAAESRNSGEKIAKVEVRVDKNEEKLSQLETWKNEITTKIGFLVSAVTVFWLLFGESLKNAIPGFF